MEKRHLFQRFIGAGLELLTTGALAVFYTEMQNTGRGFEPNLLFWKTFIIIHMAFLIVVPLFANGRTLAMLLTNLTVTSNSGKKPNCIQILIRALVGFGPVVLTGGFWYIVSLITSLMDSKGRGWGEIVSYTTIKQRNPR
ncbi:RDD family protein [Halobacillus karajensis]|uniref:RDD family protein n=1 Tax=Halobacillus karajensis TaxID=195088 RepID=UPI0008A80FF6|nr:RDD family protein [Halobacillus karajensis]SEH64194.1 RDD family protein [Halobacillus karajensis]